MGWTPRIAGRVEQPPALNYSIYTDSWYAGTTRSHGISSYDIESTVHWQTSIMFIPDKHENICSFHPTVTTSGAIFLPQNSSSVASYVNILHKREHDTVFSLLSLHPQNNWVTPFYQITIHIYGFVQLSREYIHSWSGMEPEIEWFQSVS